MTPIMIGIRHFLNLIRTVKRSVYYKYVVVFPRFISGDNFFIHWVDRQYSSQEDIFVNSSYFGNFIYEASLQEKIQIIGLVMDGHPQFNQIVRTPTPFVYQYVKWSDIVLGLFQTIFRIRNDPIRMFGKHRNGGDFKNILFYKAFLRIFDAMPDGAKVVYPFENQPWEKAMLMARRKSNKNVTMYAYQFFPIAENFLIYRFSELEKKKGWLPDCILISDAFSHALFEKQNLKTIKLGNMRYHKQLNQPIIPPTVKDTILCCLSFDPTEARNLTRIIINIASQAQVKVIINYHNLLPSNDLQEIRSMIDSHPSITLSNKRASDILESAFLLIYNESSVFLDAALRGIPTMYMSYGGINMDRFHGMGYTSHSSEEAIDFVRKLQSDESFYIKNACHVHTQSNQLIYPYEPRVVEEIFS